LVQRNKIGDMPATGDDARYWRARAANAGLLAGQMTNPEARLSMLEIARGYEALGNYVERRAKNPSRLVDSGVPELPTTQEAEDGAQPMEGASFGPEALNILCRAFDKAWRSIAAHFGDDQTEVEAVRVKLANALLSVVDENSHDVDVLAHAALGTMALDYRSDLDGSVRKGGVAYTFDG
jgi:hypothetical protein